MSYKDGMSALNLEMSKRVPRTEYSVHCHWELVKKVTGIDVDNSKSQEIHQKAISAFLKAWNFDIFWATYIHAGIFGELRTKMGHAEYATGGVDYSPEVSCPFKSPEEVLDFDPWQAYGKIDKAKIAKEFENHNNSQKLLYPDTVTMTGIYDTCISGLIDIFGFEMMLLGAGTDIARFGEMTNRYCSWIQQYFDALAQADVPVVMVHDDIVWTSGPFLPPDWFRKYVFPNYKKFMEPLKSSGKKILFTSDGDYTAFLDDVVSCGADGVVMEPSTDMKYFAEKYGKTHSFVGNADTRVLLYGTKEEIRSEVQRCMDIGKKCPGFIMAVGNHIPSNTPIENALYYNEVYEELSKR